MQDTGIQSKILSSTKILPDYRLCKFCKQQNKTVEGDKIKEMKEKENNENKYNNKNREIRSYSICHSI